MSIFGVKRASDENFCTSTLPGKCKKVHREEPAFLLMGKIIYIIKGVSLFINIFTVPTYQNK